MKINFRAHSHMVWWDAGRDNQTSALELVDEYLAHNISVGAVELDSGWSTGFNNFIPNPKKFPDFQGMMANLKSKGVRVMMWATSMMNVDSPEYEYGYNHSYYLNWGRTIHWWHGSGSFLDYTNPDAVAWWHSMMDTVINLGIDGWKCDGIDPFIYELVIAYGYAGIVTEREYADAYYRDFLYYTRTKNPDALIWARPCDSYGSYYCLDFAPRDTVFAGWVGDQVSEFDKFLEDINNLSLLM